MKKKRTTDKAGAHPQSKNSRKPLRPIMGRTTSSAITITTPRVIREIAARRKKGRKVASQ